MKFSVKTTKDFITPSIDLKNQRLTALPQDAVEKYKELTPRRTGLARRQTKLVKETIVADYEYAGALDKGWSKQAPEGMTKPFSLWLRKQADLIIKRK